MFYFFLNSFDNIGISIKHNISINP